MKRNTHAKLVLCLFSIICTGVVHAEFADVDVTHPNFHAIHSLETNHIVKGYQKGDQRFYRPLNSILRSEALKVLMLAANIDIVDPGVDYFKDVPSDQWYAPFVNTAADLEIVSGFADGNFHPAAQVSRSEFLKMLVLSFNIPVEEEVSGENWYDRFYRATGNFRILDDVNASPYESVSRGEVAELIYRSQKVAESGFLHKYVYSGEGSASYYNEGFAGKKTANGEIYDPMGLTAAHRTLPFGTFLKVSHGDNFVIVRVNDRGPYHKQRIIDLSQKAFERLSPISQGVIDVTFEVMSSPSEESVEVPASLQEHFVTEMKNETLPPAVSEKVSVLRNPRMKKKGKTIPVFSKTIAHLSPDFFPNATLRRSIPQVVVEGTIFRMSGTAKESGYEKATVFLQRISAEEGITDDQVHFSGPVSGRNFSFPLYFLEPGLYHIGLVFDDERTSRVEEIEVVPVPKERIFPASNTRFYSDLDVRVIPENKKIELSLNNASTLVSKLVFTQQGKEKVLIIEDGIDSISLDTSFFNTFFSGETMKIELFQALSNDGSFEQQTTNWKSVKSQEFQLVAGFIDTESEKISVYNFPRFPKTLDSIVLEGKLLTSDVELLDHAFVMTPSENVKQISIEKRGIDEFRLRIRPEAFGTYVLEILSTEGEVLFNRALYISKQYILPIIQWKSVEVTTQSISGIRYWTNELRAKHHVKPVFADNDLNAFAQKYAEKMALENFISHTSPTGMTFEMRLRRENFQGDYGENLSYGTNLSVALTGLKNSSSHLQNMILQKWTRVGIGFAKNRKGEVYVSQVFGR